MRISRLLVAAIFFVIAISGGRTGISADMQYQLAVVVGGGGDIFIADRDLPGIWKVAGDAGSLFFQGEKKIRTPLNAIRCLAIDQDGQLLAGDSSTREIYRFDAEGQPQPLTKGEIGIPIAMAVSKTGDIFVADLESHVIFKVAKDGGKPVEFAKVIAPRGMTIDDEGNLFIVCHRNDLLIKLNATGEKTVVIAGQPLKSPSFAAGIVLGKDQAAFIADGYNHAIWKVAAGGKPEQFAAGKPLMHPVGLAWRGENLLVADPHAKGLIEIDPAGKLTKLKIAE